MIIVFIWMSMGMKKKKKNNRISMWEIASFVSSGSMNVRLMFISVRRACSSSKRSTSFPLFAQISVHNWLINSCDSVRIFHENHQSFHRCMHWVGRNWAMLNLVDDYETGVLIRMLFLSNEHCNGLLEWNWSTMGRRKILITRSKIVSIHVVTRWIPVAAPDTITIACGCFDLILKNYCTGFNVISQSSSVGVDQFRHFRRLKKLFMHEIFIGPSLQIKNFPNWNCFFPGIVLLIQNYRIIHILSFVTVQLSTNISLTYARCGGFHLSEKSAYQGFSQTRFISSYQKDW